MDEIGKPATAAASRSSQRRGGRRTSKTSAAATLTPAEALEIFQQAVLELRQAGVDVSWAPYEGGVILFRLGGVRLCPSCRILRPAGEMTEAGMCRYCADSADISAHPGSSISAQS